jgi:hypothetical protein
MKNEVVFQVPIGEGEINVGFPSLSLVAGAKLHVAKLFGSDIAK